MGSRNIRGRETSNREGGWCNTFEYNKEGEECNAERSGEGDRYNVFTEGGYETLREYIGEELETSQLDAFEQRG